MLFAGDLTIWGLLTVASLFDLPGLRNFVVRLYESYQIWLVVVISFVWWGLLVRVIMIIALATGSGGLNPMRVPTKPGEQAAGAIRKLYKRLFTDEDKGTSGRS